MTGVDCEALRAIKFLRDQCGFCCGDPDSEISRAWKAIEAKSAAYDALVADLHKLVASWENCYEMCGSIAYRNCTDELERLLVSDDRPSHTAGENDA